MKINISNEVIEEIKEINYSLSLSIEGEKREKLLTQLSFTCNVRRDMVMHILHQYDSLIEILSTPFLNYEIDKSVLWKLSSSISLLLGIPDLIIANVIITFRKLAKELQDSERENLWKTLDKPSYVLWKSMENSPSIDDVVNY